MAARPKGSSRTGTTLLLSTAIESWLTALEAKNLSPKTVKSYADSAGAFTRWLEAEGKGDPRIGELDATLMRRFQSSQLANRAATTARARHVALKILFGWLVDEDELESNPMDKVDRPIVPDKVPALISEPELRALLKSFKGKAGSVEGEFRRRRDHAIIVMYLNTGARLSEIANLQLEDIDMKARTIRVLRKGRRDQVLSFGPGVATITDAYLRARREHREAKSPWLWLGKQGRLTSVGIGQMIQSRGAEAGIEGAHAHRFRHTWTADRLRKGLSDAFLVELGGWSSPAMLARYGKAVRNEHAREANAELPEIV